MKNLIVMLTTIGFAVGCESSTKLVVDAPASASSTSTSFDAVSVSDSSVEACQSENVSTNHESPASLSSVLATLADAGVLVHHVDASKVLETKKK